MVLVVHGYFDSEEFRGSPMSAPSTRRTTERSQTIIGYSGWLDSPIQIIHINLRLVFNANIVNKKNWRLKLLSRKTVIVV